MPTHMTEPAEVLHHLRFTLARNSSDAIQSFVASYQPADLAELLFDLSPDDRIRLVEGVEPLYGARLVRSLEYEEQRELVLSLPLKSQARLLGAMPLDDLVDLLATFPPGEIEGILALIPNEAESVRGLMQYSETSAGGIMTSDFIALPCDTTVEETLDHLRTLQPDTETAFYIYVTDTRGALVGVVSLRQLVIAQPHVALADVVTGDVVSVPADMHQEMVARLFERYGFLALPVINGLGHPIGVITVDDVIDVIQEETSEDIARMGGLEPLEEGYLSARVSRLVRKRLGWLLVLFAAQSVTGNILSLYEETLATITVLAIFIPLLIGTGGNAGAQASTLVVRAMAIGEVRFQDVFNVILRESFVGLLLGGVMALVAFFWSQIFGTGFAIGLTVGLTVLAIVILASCMGASLPILARKLGLDPAVASAPLVTTVADASGLFIYFTVARAVLNL